MMPKWSKNLLVLTIAMLCLPMGVFAQEATPHVEGAIEQDDAPIVQASGDFSVFAASCPAAATGIQHTDAASVTSVEVRQSGTWSPISPNDVTDLEGTEARFRVNYDYAVSSAAPGDFLNVPLPDGFRTFSVPTVTLYNDAGDSPVACLTVTNGDIQVVFLDYVIDRPLIEGTFFAEYQIQWINEGGPQTTVVTIPGFGVITNNPPEGSGPVGPPDPFNKQGWMADRNRQDVGDYLYWQFDLPRQPAGEHEVDIEIVDTYIAPNWEFVCVPTDNAEPVWAIYRPSGETPDYPAVFTYTCDPEVGIIIHITQLPTNVETKIRFIGQITVASSVYRNEATYTSTDEEIIDSSGQIMQSGAGGDGDGNQVTPTPVTPSPTATPTQPVETPTEPVETPTEPAATPTEPASTPNVPGETPTPVVPTGLPNTGDGSAAQATTPLLIAMAAVMAAGVGVVGMRYKRS